jgi:hypothetical protein
MLRPFSFAAMLSEPERRRGGWRSVTRVWRNIMNRTIGISVGGLILLLIVVAIIF